MSALGQKRTEAAEKRVRKNQARLKERSKASSRFPANWQLRLRFLVSSSECQVSKAAIPYALLVFAFLVFSARAFAKGGGNGAGIAKPPG
jgi:hypothetical protein